MRMYELRKKWSAAYAKGRRFLGMRSNQSSESLTSKFHLNLHRQMSLVNLVEHYEFIVTTILLDQLELDEKTETFVHHTDISAGLLEKNAARMFTRPMFKKARVQIRGLCNWDVACVSVDNGMMICEVLLKSNKEKQFLVSCTFDQSAMLTVSCECRMMECRAFPCAYMFRVMRFQFTSMTSVTKLVLHFQSFKESRGYGQSYEFVG
ncbi:hypothetical protein EJB05_30789, partial [Eragrostis curvula]